MADMRIADQFGILTTHRVIDYDVFLQGPAYNLSQKTNCEAADWERIERNAFSLVENPLNKLLIKEEDPFSSLAMRNIFGKEKQFWPNPDLLKSKYRLAGAIAEELEEEIKEFTYSKLFPANCPFRPKRIKLSQWLVRESGTKDTNRKMFGALTTAHADRSPENLAQFMREEGRRLGFDDTDGRAEYQQRNYWISLEGNRQLLLMDNASHSNTKFEFGKHSDNLGTQHVRLHGHEQPFPKEGVNGPQLHHRFVKMPVLRKDQAVCFISAHTDQRVAVHAAVPGGEGRTLEIRVIEQLSPDLWKHASNFKGQGFWTDHPTVIKKQQQGL